MKFNEKIESKRNDEQVQEKMVRNKADEDYLNWKNQRSIRLKAKMDSNRMGETQFLQTIITGKDRLKVWDDVGKLINTQLTDSTEYKGPDITRMKNLLIDLKNFPPVVKETADVISKWDINPLNSPSQESISFMKNKDLKDPSPILNSYAPSTNPLGNSKRYTAGNPSRCIEGELYSELTQQTEVISDAALHQFKIIEDETE